MTDTPALDILQAKTAASLPLPRVRGATLGAMRGATLGSDAGVITPSPKPTEPSFSRFDKMPAATAGALAGADPKVNPGAYRYEALARLSNKAP